MKAAAGAADAVKPPPAGITILLYHRVGARTAVEVDLPVELFAEQMAYLAANHDVVTLDRAVELLTSDDGAAVGDHVVVTFDDGTADVVDDAVPVLVDTGVPATLFVATDFVEERRPFPDDGAPASWSGLADAASTGMLTIGSHTHTHLLLDRLGPAEVDDELDRSVALIEDRVGRPCRHFAYPKAVAGSAHADASVRQRFASASLAGNRPNVPGSTDVHRLGRTPVQRSDGMRWFQRKAQGGMAFEATVRELANRWRYAGLRG
jgi:peptidoglycan/xylan/chitin deacetylase (PgdA/CDA1 family)